MLNLVKASIHCEVKCYNSGTNLSYHCVDQSRPLQSCVLFLLFLTSCGRLFSISIISISSPLYGCSLTKGTLDLITTPLVLSFELLNVYLYIHSCNCST